MTRPPPLFDVPAPGALFDDRPLDDADTTETHRAAQGPNARDADSPEPGCHACTGPHETDDCPHGQALPLIPANLLTDTGDGATIKPTQRKGQK